MICVYQDDLSVIDLSVQRWFESYSFECDRFECIKMVWVWLIWVYKNDVSVMDLSVQRWFECDWFECIKMIWSWVSSRTRNSLWHLHPSSRALETYVWSISACSASHSQFASLTGWVWWREYSQGGSHVVLHSVSLREWVRGSGCEGVSLREWVWGRESDAVCVK